MNIDYIREFTVLAETCSFSEASEALFISQSSLSKHIKSLENDLGVLLFDRSTRSVTLSDSGRIFLNYAGRIAQIQQEYTAVFARRKQNGGSLSVGVIPGIGQYNLTDIFVDFKREYKNLSVDVIEGESDYLKSLLCHHKCDLAFLRDKDGLKDSQLEVLPYSEDCLSAVLPVSHPLAGRSRLSLSELKEENLMLVSERTLMHDLCIGACRSAGFEPRISFTSHSGRILADMTGHGMGVSLLMKKTTSHLLPPGTVAVDIEPRISSKIVLVYGKDRGLSPAARHFLHSVIPSQKSIEQTCQT